MHRAFRHGAQRSCRALPSCSRRLQAPSWTFENGLAALQRGHFTRFLSCSRLLRAGVQDPLAARQSHSGAVLIIDGGLSTHIEALGETIDNSLWSARCLVNNPGVIRQAHADYYAAGADIAITASYQAHFDGFKELGVSNEEALEAIRRSVTIAREAAPPGALVAGSVGAYGASKCNGAEYTGDYPGMDEEKLIEWHRPRMKALVEAGCDVLACETVPCRMEAKAMRTIAEELSCPAWITFSCKSDSQVCSGESLSDCVAALADSSYIIGVGVNCSDPGFVASLVRICRSALPASKHVIVYPNSGEAYCGETRSWVSGTAAADDQFVEMAKEWAQLGADCIGGCCRTTPATIAALRAAFPRRL
eukprot:gb/GFBE01071912.1/.p1 GENE.gb/GFBE01071912.1/~~gb/GFBE01071912.1/.p1  ORF type:complete len:363 (+),score=72.62 gb/GFBE01071912.1/:1-1089(+)